VRYISVSFQFSSTEHFCEILTRSPPTWCWIQLCYINFAIFWRHKCFLPWKTIPSWQLCFRQRPPSLVSHNASSPWTIPLWKFTVVTLYALLTRDLLAIAKFLVLLVWLCTSQRLLPLDPIVVVVAVDFIDRNDNKRAETNKAHCCQIAKVQCSSVYSLNARQLNSSDTGAVHYPLLRNT